VAGRPLVKHLRSCLALDRDLAGSRCQGCAPCGASPGIARARWRSGPSAIRSSRCRFPSVEARGSPAAFLPRFRRSATAITPPRAHRPGLVSAPARSTVINVQKNLTSVNWVTSVLHRPRHLTGTFGWTRRLRDMEKHHAKDRSVGSERHEGRARPAVARSTSAAGARRACPRRATDVEAVAATARAAPPGVANLCECASRTTSSQSPVNRTAVATGEVDAE
jgi:hypothetical protein